MQFKLECVFFFWWIFCADFLPSKSKVAQKWQISFDVETIDENSAKGALARKIPAAFSSLRNSFSGLVVSWSFFHAITMRTESSSAIFCSYVAHSITTYICESHHRQLSNRIANPFHSNTHYFASIIICANKISQKILLIRLNAIERAPWHDMQREPV